MYKHYHTGYMLQKLGLNHNKLLCNSSSYITICFCSAGGAPNNPPSAIFLNSNYR